MQRFKITITLNDGTKCWYDVPEDELMKEIQSIIHTKNAQFSIQKVSA